MLVQFNDKNGRPVAFNAAQVASVWDKSGGGVIVIRTTDGRETEVTESLADIVAAIDAGL